MVVTHFVSLLVLFVVLLLAPASDDSDSDVDDGGSSLDSSEDEVDSDCTLFDFFVFFPLQIGALRK